MNLFKKMFGKNCSELSIKDLREFFFAGQEETNTLEFKSGDVEIEKIYKEITAFLNTEGGLLIIGTPKERTETRGRFKKTICQGELVPSSFKSKAWVFQKIMANITPPPVGITGFDHCDENGSVIVLDIPQSTTPPHQCCADGRYYIRIDAESRPAPHGIVQALFNKRKRPLLQAGIKHESKNTQSDIITLRIKNLSGIPAEKTGILVEVYNAHEVHQDEYPVMHTNNDEILGRRYSIQASINDVLVRPLHFPLSFTVTHKSKPYLIQVGYWCRDSEYDFQFWTYDPIKKMIQCEGQMSSGDCNFFEELKKVQSP